jgi:hypothetical protein
MITPRRSIRVRSLNQQNMTTRNPNMDIHNLLNPEVSVSPMSHQRQIPRPDHIPRSAPATSLPLKKEKDMPTYRKQRPKLPVNFPPYAADPTSRIHEIHKAHGLFPLGDISEYAAHIPYSSSKTQFQEKTGRTAVEGMIIASTVKNLWSLLTLLSLHV